MQLLKPRNEKCCRIGIPNRHTTWFIVAAVAVLFPFSAVAQQTAAQAPQSEIIGTIEGPAIALKGPMSVQVVGNEVKTLLRSGVDVRVKAGHARINLIEGGSIAICGPAHISMLKAANGLTIAMDSGTIHAHILGNLTLNVFTTQILAKSIAIGEGLQDLLVGIDTPGLMCVRAERGAVRLQEQFGNQSVVVPQGGDVTLANGQLEGMRINSALCACDLYEAEVAENSKVSAPEISTPATSEEVRKSNALKNPVPPKKLAGPVDSPKLESEPTYQVYMPPLRYDATQKVQDEPDPKLIVLVRRVRVRPTLIFESRVEGDVIATEGKSLSAAAVVKTQTTAIKPSAPANAGLMDRVKTFLRSLWAPSS